MNASDIAVALLLYNRPQHTMRVLESLVQNGVTTCHAFLDKAETRTDRAKQALIRAVLSNCPGMRVHLREAPVHLGLARSVRNAMDTLTRSHQGVVLLEDDCLLRPGAVRYFHDALVHFRDDRRVRSICGYMFPGLELNWEDNPDLLLLRRFFPWGWATWSDRWQDYRPDLRQALGRLNSRPGAAEMLGDDMRRLCLDQGYLSGRRDIWSLSWIVEHYATDTFAVYPRETLVDNIGCDGSGKHCLATDSFDHTGHVNAYSPWRFERLVHRPENEAGVQAFLDQTSLLTYPPTEAAGSEAPIPERPEAMAPDKTGGYAPSGLGYDFG